MTCLRLDHQAPAPTLPHSPFTERSPFVASPPTLGEDMSFYSSQRPVWCAVSEIPDSTIEKYIELVLSNNGECDPPGTAKSFDTACVRGGIEGGLAEKFRSTFAQNIQETRPPPQSDTGPRSSQDVLVDVSYAASAVGFLNASFYRAAAQVISRFKSSTTGQPRTVPQLFHEATHRDRGRYEAFLEADAGLRSLRGDTVRYTAGPAYGLKDTPRISDEPASYANPMDDLADEIGELRISHDALLEDISGAAARSLPRSGRSHRSHRRRADSATTSTSHIIVLAPSPPRSRADRGHRATYPDSSVQGAITLSIDDMPDQILSGCVRAVAKAARTRYIPKDCPTRMREELRNYVRFTGCEPSLTISRSSPAALRLESVAISVLKDYARDCGAISEADYDELLSLDATGQLVADVLNTDYSQDLLDEASRRSTRVGGRNYTR